MFQVALIALAMPAFSLGTASAHEDAKVPVTQTWSVTFMKDTAVLRASKETEVRFVQATIMSLQTNGLEKFALRSQSTNALDISDHSITIRLHDGEAAVSASYECHYKHVVAVVSMLADNDVRKVKFVEPEQKAMKERVSQEAR